MNDLADPHESTALAATEAASPSAASGPAASGSASDLQLTAPAPAHIDGYQMLRPLGRGAFGTVWLARQCNTGKHVAIKFYAHKGDIDWTQLSREVEKLAALYTNRDIVQLIAVGWDAAPPYYIMEYLEHGSLQQLLRRGPLSGTEAVRITRGVATALVHAHGRGILHCDLKPANVLLDAEYRPRLCDFGQSRLSTEQSPSLGTFFYMAPEQADVHAVADARWDVYALGAMLYAMLTGEPPYKSPEARRLLQGATTLLDRLARYRELLRGAPPIAAVLRRRGIDAALREILGRCLAVNPAERYPNAQAVLSALDARAARRTRRPLLLIGALGPVLLLIVMSLSGIKVVRTAMQTSTAALTRRALESNRFAAKFVAETVAREIDHRWSALEDAAADPALLAALAELAEPGHSPERTAELQQTLQAWVEDVNRQNADLGADSWLVSDASGLQWARVPHSETIGQSWAFRDYFHGQGRDYQRNQVPVGLKPIHEVHRSVVFPSAATGNRIVAFSAPIWSPAQPGRPRPRHVLGVLAMTVELGRFGELNPEGGMRTRQFAVLTDSLEDWTRRKGLILQHPRLHELMHHGAPLPEYRLDPSRVRTLEELRAFAARGEPRPAYLAVDERYPDPVGGDYAGQWVAALEPVFARGRDTGWVVIVQEQYREVSSPVDLLGRTLLRIGAWGIGLAAVVLTVLWGLLVVFLGAATRRRPSAPADSVEPVPADDANPEPTVGPSIAGLAATMPAAPPAPGPAAEEASSP